MNINTYKLGHLLTIQDGVTVDWVSITDLSFLDGVCTLRTDDLRIQFRVTKEDSDKLLALSECYTRAQSLKCDRGLIVKDYTSRIDNQSLPFTLKGKDEGGGNQSVITLNKTGDKAE